MATNVLYLGILPIIHVSLNQVMGFGLTEQILTLFPDRNFATEFFPDEVGDYIATFKHREKHLIGGHVTRYELIEERTANGRVIVKVIQHVA